MNEKVLGLHNSACFSLEYSSSKPRLWTPNTMSSSGQSSLRQSAQRLDRCQSSKWPHYTVRADAYLKREGQKVSVFQRGVREGG